MLGVFNSKVSSFNAAVRAQDAEAVSEIGAELLRIGLEECAKPNVGTGLKETYRKQCLSVVAHLERLARTASSAHAGAGAGAAAEGGDPYYTPQQWFSDEAPDLGFKDIIGAQEVRNAFMVDVVAPLRSELRDIYRKFRGDQLGTQILLYGPPGTGKTHIVKCLAGALNCKIAVVQTSEVLASVVGVAEKNIRDIFAQAAKLNRCVIFFDEIDSICADRTSDDSRHTKSILTTLLTCMDGFLKTKQEGQLRIIVAATNLPWKLDPALKRGGRFETQIYVPLPGKDAVKEFIRLYLKDLPHDPDVTVEALAEKLMGYSGADIKAVMKQIANLPLRREIGNVLSKEIGRPLGERVTMKDCNEVLDRYINSVTPEMLHRFEAYHLGMSYADYLTLRLKAAAEEASAEAENGERPAKGSKK